MTEAETIASKLTKAQRLMVIASEPGGWGRDWACGVGVHGSGRWTTARRLAAAGLGDIEEQPDMYPSGVYFNNDLGLTVRAAILATEREKE